MFADNLKLARKQAGYTRKYMAGQIGVSPSSYGFYEQSKNMPSVDNLIKIANILHVSIDFLLDNMVDAQNEYQRCRQLLYPTCGVYIADLDDGKIKITGIFPENNASMIMTKDNFIKLVHKLERRNSREITQKLYNVLNQSYTNAVYRKFSAQIKAEPLEYIDTP